MQMALLFGLIRCCQSIIKNKFERQYLMADDFVCPCCGEPISANARFCRHCGADERTGWSDQTYLDGIDLPDPDEYEELREKEFEKKKKGNVSIGWRTIVGIVLLVIMTLFLVVNAVF